MNWGRIGAKFDELWRIVAKPLARPQSCHYLGPRRQPLAVFVPGPEWSWQYHSLIKELNLCVKSLFSPPLRLLLFRSLLARKAPRTPLAKPLIRLLPTWKPTLKPLATPLTPLLLTLPTLLTKLLLRLTRPLLTSKRPCRTKPKKKHRLTNSLASILRIESGRAVPEGAALFVCAGCSGHSPSGERAISYRLSYRRSRR